MNKDGDLLAYMREVGFSSVEARVYLELLKTPATHAQLSLLTDINRTTLYRLVRKLEKRGLVTKRVDDRGSFLIAADPATLETDILSQESRARQQRTALLHLLPKLEAIKLGYAADFAVQFYEGTDGLKRMLWHELKAINECVCIGGETLENLIDDRRWAEEHRQHTVEAGYVLRELSNPGVTPSQFTDNKTFLEEHYALRIIPRSVVPINHLTTAYNNTVAIYNVYEGRRMGIEIVSKTYAETVRSIFEIFWNQAA